MYSPTEKKTENKASLASNETAQRQNSGGPAFQHMDNRPETIIQRKLSEAAIDSPNAKQIRQLQTIADPDSVASQKKENKTGLPDNLKSGIENLSGYAMNDVNVNYNSDKPAKLQAHAYAQGTNIHIAPGQEKNLPHEAWHVVQQKQGRVKPTIQMKGKINVNDDAGLEKEADTMGARAVQSSPVQQKKLSNNYGSISNTVQRVGGASLGFEGIEDGFSEHIQRLFMYAKKLVKEMKDRIHTEILEPIKAKTLIGDDKVDHVMNKYPLELSQAQMSEGMLKNALEELKKENPETYGEINIIDDKIMKGEKSIATITKAEKAFEAQESTGEEHQRPLYNKKGKLSKKEYVEDNLGLKTRRYAYVEKNFFHVLELLQNGTIRGKYFNLNKNLTNHAIAEKRQNKLIGQGGHAMLSKNIEENSQKQTVDGVISVNLSSNGVQKAILHQMLGNSSEQRGVSLTSTPKKDVVVSNDGDLFKNPAGVLFKIDLARIPKEILLLNVYKEGSEARKYTETEGVDDKNTKVSPKKKGIPLPTGSSYDFTGSIVKNRELYLEELKPEWIVEMTVHPEETVIDLSKLSPVESRKMIGNAVEGTKEALIGYHEQMQTQGDYSEKLRTRIQDSDQEKGIDTDIDIYAGLQDIATDTFKAMTNSKHKTRTSKLAAVMDKWDVCIKGIMASLGQAKPEGGNKGTNLAYEFQEGYTAGRLMGRLLAIEIGEILQFEEASKQKKLDERHSKYWEGFSKGVSAANEDRKASTEKINTSRRTFSEKKIEKIVKKKGGKEGGKEVVEEVATKGIVDGLTPKDTVITSKGNSKADVTYTYLRDRYMVSGREPGIETHEAEAEAPKLKEPDGYFESNWKSRVMSSPSKWSSLLQPLSGGYQPNPNSLSPADVLIAISQSGDFEGVDNFWDAYNRFRRENPNYTYTLSPISVIKMRGRENPMSLAIMSPSDWRIYNDFKIEHPEFNYSH